MKLESSCSSESEKEARKLEVIEALGKFDFNKICDLFNEATQEIRLTEGPKRKLKPETQWGLSTEDAERCLFDRTRTELFKKAIESIIKKSKAAIETNVKPGDVVVEAGAGTGVLALLAVIAGAKKVYAIEINQLTAEICRKFIEYCGFEDQVEVIVDDATKCELSEKADVILSENMYTGLLEEPQMQIMEHLRKFLKENGRVIPEFFESYIELISSPDIGVTNKVRREIEGQIDFASSKVKFDEVFFDRPQPLAFDNTVTVVATKNARINAVNISSRIFLTRSLIIEPETCDFLGNDEVIYLNEPLDVKKGKKYNICISYKGGDKPRDIQLKITPVE